MFQEESLKSTMSQVQDFKVVLTVLEYLRNLNVTIDADYTDFASTTLLIGQQELQLYPLRDEPQQLLFKTFREAKPMESFQPPQSLGVRSSNFQSKFTNRILLSNNFEILNDLIGTRNMRHLLENFSIIIKQDRVHVQINGPPLGTLFKKAYAVKQPLVSTKSKVPRQQIFYCWHMNRQPGLFRKNFISAAQRQVKRGDLVSETAVEERAAKNLMEIGFRLKEPNSDQGKDPLAKPLLNSKEWEALSKLFVQLITNLRKFDFNRLLRNYCRLPKEYKKLRDQMKQHLKEQKDFKERARGFYDKCYQYMTPYEAVLKTLQIYLNIIIPDDIFGRENKSGFLEGLQGYVFASRFETQSYMDYLVRMNVLNVPWLNPYYNRKIHSKVISRKRQVICEIIALLFHHVIIPFIRLNFFVTDMHGQEKTIFYFRKPLWMLVQTMALRQLELDNFDHSSPPKGQFSKFIRESYVGKLRIMPKQGTFRPIITYNRINKSIGKWFPILDYKNSLSVKLEDAKVVLRHLKNRLFESEVGYSVFDNRQIFNRLKSISEAWLALGKPQLYYLTLDIRKCYDNIQLPELLQLLRESDLFNYTYMITKYGVLERNLKTSTDRKAIHYLFNYKQRISAIPLDSGLQGYDERTCDGKVRVVSYIQIVKQVTLMEIFDMIEKVLQCNFVQWRSRIFKQRVGIPQGLNISGVLCSFYISHLERKLFTFVQDTQQINQVMRLTDDYLYVTNREQNLIELVKGLETFQTDSKFQFNLEKLTSNSKIGQSRHHECKWVGKLIDFSKMTILPLISSDPASNYHKYINKLGLVKSVSVNYPSSRVRRYLKNKLKSLLLNQFGHLITQMAPIRHKKRLLKLHLKVMNAFKSRRPP